MNLDPQTFSRKERRFQVRIPVMVSGVAQGGDFFRSPAETLNGSTEGMGLLLDQKLNPSSALIISISKENEHVLQIQSEVRHVTRFDDQRNLVGVKFRKMAFV